MRSVDSDVVGGNRVRVLKAFQKLRREGFIARANFLCCGSCAGYAISMDLGEMTPERRAKFKGTVFWHRQSEGHIWDSGILWLGHGPVEFNEVVYGLSGEEIGKRVVQALTEEGLKVEWDGTCAQKIKVDLNVSEQKQAQ